MNFLAIIGFICILHAPNIRAKDYVKRRYKPFRFDDVHYREVEFNCKPLTSTEPPSSVHQLMPGDIKVVGALGDSLTAGNGAKADTLPEVAIQYRGVVAAVGGDEDLNTVTTLPNIFRRYNEKLYGFSTGTGGYTDPNSKFNVAIPGAKSPGMEEQAVDLVSRITNDVNVDYENDWKLITIFIGYNDLCQWCNDEVNRSPEMYVANIEKAIAILQQMPKTFVNILGILNVYQISSLQGGVCDIVHQVVCGCGMGDEDKIEELRKINKEYQRLLEESVTSGKFDNREDFTVVYQPFFHDTDMPKLPNGSSDLSYFAPDCFHLSEKGNAAGSVALWNNMIEPVGEKTTSWDDIHHEIKCPTQESPYLFTNVNSNPKRLYNAASNIDEKLAPNVNSNPKRFYNADSNIDEKPAPNVNSNPKRLYNAGGNIDEKPAPNVNSNPKRLYNAGSNIHEKPAPNVNSNPKRLYNAGSNIDEKPAPNVNSNPKRLYNAGSNIDKKPAHTFNNFEMINKDGNQQQSTPTSVLVFGIVSGMLVISLAVIVSISYVRRRKVTNSAESASLLGN